MYHFAERFIHFSKCGLQKGLGEDRYCVTEGQTSASRMAEFNQTGEPDGELQLCIILSDAFIGCKNRGHYHLYFAPSLYDVPPPEKA